MKKVIFIGGISYSGSTLLDMILSNDPDGYSLGEVHAMFRPYRFHHYKELEYAKRDKDWYDILSDCEKNLFSNLFIKYPNLNFAVDSSKNPFWITAQMKYLNNQGISYNNVLIYKSPQEFAHSFEKRNKLNILEKSLKSYYKTYRYFISEYKSISYKQLIQDEDALRSLCIYLDIPYLKGKKHYWNKNHKTFFGNNRARAHTANLKSKGKELTINLTEEGKKTLYYNPPKDECLIRYGSYIEDKCKNILRICTYPGGGINHDYSIIMLRFKYTIKYLIHHYYSYIKY